MKIQRREFKHPDGFFVTEMKKPWPWGDPMPTQVWYGKCKSEVRSEAKTFIDSVGPEKLVNVSEYTSDKEFGERQNFHIVVWYWG